MSDLAIVIPAYKEKYLKKSLDSIAGQTNKNFTVYIGDDCSPFDLQSIVNDYHDKFTIHYTRFPDNIGAKNLVLQWKRCIALSTDEKWLWLFSDDDIMDDNCVEQFYKTIDQTGDAFEIYRFNTISIDAYDTILNINPTGPEVESSEKMAYHLLKGERGNSMPDHIFNRDVYNRCGGFVFTEYAQGADWAMSILFSQQKGMCIIPHAKLYWRYSGNNISSIAAANKNSMINGHLQFIKWILAHFEYLKKVNQEITYQMICDAAMLNLKVVMIYHYKGFNLANTWPLVNLYHRKLKLSYLNSIIQLVHIQAPFHPIIYKLVKLRNMAKNIFK